MEENKNGFEEKLSRLDALVRTLESGDCSLEQSLKIYEEGTLLVNECSNILSKSEQRVSIIRNSFNSAPVSEDFND